jgi:hypothetical protein
MKDIAAIALFLRHAAAADWPSEEGDLPKYRDPCPGWKSPAMTPEISDQCAFSARSGWSNAVLFPEDL